MTLPQTTRSDDDAFRMVHLVVPSYKVEHPIVIIAQQWPCWLSSVVSLSLPVDRIFVARFQCVFGEPSQVKLMSSWSPLDHITTLTGFENRSILGSGSLEFLGELPKPLLDEAAVFVYACELNFRRFHRKRDFDRMLRTVSARLAGLGLDATVVHHADFGGVTNAS